MWDPHAPQALGGKQLPVRGGQPSLTADIDVWVDDGNGREEVVGGVARTRGADEHCRHPRQHQGGIENKQLVSWCGGVHGVCVRGGCVGVHGVCVRGGCEECMVYV